jgi:hypothetical protein
MAPPHASIIALSLLAHAAPDAMHKLQQRFISFHHFPSCQDSITIRTILILISRMGAQFIAFSIIHTRATRKAARKKQHPESSP